MKIVNIIGGLGNQMMQYAFALSLQKHFPQESVMIDIHHFRGYTLHNGFELKRVFAHVSLPIASRKEIAQLSYYVPSYKLSKLVRRVLPIRKTEFVEPLTFIYYPEVFEKNGDCYYEGYWSAMPILAPLREDLLRVYDFGQPAGLNETLSQEMTQCVSVSIHVRRGDYLKDPEWKGVTTLTYYKEAVRRILSKEKEVRFYLFSDDIAWCQSVMLPMLESIAKELNAQQTVRLVTHNRNSNSHWDMYLMSKSNYLVIANSTFSWWAAFLNANQTHIYAPNRWVNRSQSVDIWPDDWVKINVE